MPPRRRCSTRLNSALFLALCAFPTLLGCGSSGSSGSPGGGAGAADNAGAGSANGGNPTGGTSATAGNAGASTPGGTSNGGGSQGGSSGAGTCLPAEPAVTNADDPTTFPAADPALANQTHHFFKITVRDSASNAALAGVQVTTVNDIVLTSDQNGVIAFYEPGLMGLNVWFSPSRAGYQYPADGLGNRGKALSATEGGNGELRMDKTSDVTVTAQGDLPSRLAAGAVPGHAECTAIRVFDQDNLRGVPAVRLSAFNEDYWSDSQGLIAYCNPDHQGANVSFAYFAHGYALADGTMSVSIATSKGGTQSVKLARQSVGERLYRTIGGGVYRDSVLLGLKTPLTSPTLNGQVLGSDTASATVYKGKLFWLWQDTNQVSYALGNFRGTSATSELPGSGGLSQNLGVDYSYFTGNNGFASAMCPDCKTAPVWIDGLASVPDAAGAEHLFAGYASVDGTGASVETGLLRFNDDKKYFEPVITNFLSRPGFQRPGGHTYQLRHGDKRYVYSDSRMRVGATSEAFLDPDHYEQFSPYDTAGSTTLLKNVDGTLDYQWRAGAQHITSDSLKAANIPTNQDLDGHELDATGAGVGMVGRSIAWNAYRRRFIQSSQQLYGSSSPLGEIWHAEADTPMGPFVYAAKVISHDNYTFYNVLHHPELDRGPFIYLEGTYTASYTNATPTPRYNYNQQLYRINLDDARLVLPVAIYDLGGALPGNFGTKAEVRRDTPALSAAFLAPDRAREGLVGVAWSGASCSAGRKLVASATPPTTPLFYALPGTTKPAPAHTVALYEYSDASGHVAYGLDKATMPAGYTRAATPLALVWENPTNVKVPVGDYLGDLVANAGADQCVTATGALTDIVLDASASTSLAGTVSKVRWHLPDCDVEGAKITAHLPKGVHDITVDITDSAGNRASDHVIVDIE